MQSIKTVSIFCVLCLQFIYNVSAQTVNKIFVEEKVYDVPASLTREVFNGKEYYIVRNNTKKQVEFYNDKHVLVKTVVYPSFPKTSATPSFITQSVFNTDDNFEIIYSLRDSAAQITKGIVMSERGDTIFKANGFIITTAPTGNWEPKVIVRKTDIQGNVSDMDVYNLKTYAFERNVKYSSMNLVNLEYSGQKYWAYASKLDSGRVVFNFLNQDFSIYKTLKLPFSSTIQELNSNQSAFILSEMSESIFSDDSTISILYTVLNFSPISTSSYLFNEKRKVELENSSNISLSKIAGQPNELIYVNSSNRGSIIALPSLRPKLDLNLQVVRRGIFKNYGVVYYGLSFSTSAGNKVNLMRSDGSLIKSISFPTIASTSTGYSLDYVTDTIFNKNDNVEFHFTENGNATVPYVTHIVDENAAILLRMPNISSLRPIFISGLPRKYYADLRENGQLAKGIVYGELTTPTNEVALSIAVKAFPNPFLESLNISLDDPNQAIKNIKILDVRGQVILQKKADNATIVLDGLNDLPSGQYLLQIDLDKISVVKKIIKL
jgi:hypothetical protein